MEVRFEQHYDSGAADLWDAVTDPERLARWFAPVEGRFGVGEAFTICFDDGDVPECRVIECVAPQRFSFEWPHASGATVVTAEVRPDGDGSVLVLTHARLGRSQAAGYAAGWDAYLRLLTDHLAGREPQNWWEHFGAAQKAYAERLG
ncbi:hypothetical protein VV02_16340 [Luteipulveratus mongoliensis]|uniref:Activator of Hsp90 ATPase homologue 1/2-like C-terminal domain-containing protein n=1 Tax=Luteipulveratus mongoliensis TaxID=571913 RepID=A0A0K1JQJ6_9MICO|nr:hypothetical protein VV02_16340 [Luteipulveratus mongoliensis]